PLKRASRGDSCHSRVDRMMTVIEPVLGCVGVLVFNEVMIREETVETPLTAQHRSHAPRYYIHMPAAFAFVGIEAAQILASEPGKILRVGELAREEATVALQALHRIWTKTPLLGFVQAGDLPADLLPAIFVVTPPL